MGLAATLVGVAVLACVAVGVVLFLLRRGTPAASRDPGGLARQVERRLEQVEQRDERLTRREETLEAKARTLELRDGNLLERERAVAAREAELEDVLIAQRKRLEEIADLSFDEARQALFERAETEARRDALLVARDIVARTREEAERRGQEIVATAVQRLAVDTTLSTTTSTVPLPDDEMKGRIIGRDGRNIRAFEHLTGVNLVVDDTPEAVVLSCFDPVRREIARLTLIALVEDGRIHPARIEREHERATTRVRAEIGRSGRAAAEEARVAGLSDGLLQLLGQLRYRTSYGQNVQRHLVESAHLAGFMADELGTNAELARRCALLHDIGKALTHEVEGSHALVGAEIAERLGESEAVCHAIAAHHGEVESRTIEAVLTQAADAISAARPGARRDVHEQFVTRLQRIEALCLAYDGVEKVYAMQAGRDVRVMVRPEVVDDAGAQALAAELAARIEEELQYPGQIAITVVRELRTTNVAH